MFGYEEALGYAIGDDVRDKDGIVAALQMADLVARLRAEGRSLDDRLAELAVAHGLHLTASRSYRFDGIDGGARLAEAMATLRAAAPTELAGRRVREIVDHLAHESPDARSDVVVIELGDGAWAAVRPSGTEPKLKIYAEVVEPVSGGDLGAARGPRPGRARPAAPGRREHAGAPRSGLGARLGSLEVRSRGMHAVGRP